MTDDLQLADLVPDVIGTGTRIAYLQLLQFQELSALVTDAPALTAKHELGKLAAAVLQRHEAAIAATDTRGVDATAQMRRVGAELDAFATRVGGRDWDERIVTCYLAASILHDFYEKVLDEHGAEADSLRASIENDDVQRGLHDIIAARINGDQPLADRLAMWGRRITGDSLLAVRRALGLPDGTPADDVRAGAEAVIESVTADLMADHSRRMNGLGLAA